MLSRPRMECVCKFNKAKGCVTDMLPTERIGFNLFRSKDGSLDLPLPTKGRLIGHRWIRKSRFSRERRGGSPFRKQQPPRLDHRCRREAENA